MQSGKTHAWGSTTVELLDEPQLFVKGDDLLIDMLLQFPQWSRSASLVASIACQVEHLNYVYNSGTWLVVAPWDSSMEAQLAQMGRVVFVDAHSIFMEFFTFDVSMSMLNTLRVARSDAILLSQTLLDSLVPTRCIEDINKIILTPMVKSKPTASVSQGASDFLLKPDL